MCGLCVVYVWLGQTKVDENTTSLERVVYLCLALNWRWSDALLAHNKWITFIRRSREIINEFLRVHDGMCDWALI